MEKWMELVPTTISALAFFVTSITLFVAVIKSKNIADSLRLFREQKTDILEMVEAIRRLNEIGVEIDRLDNIIPKLRVALQDFEETVEEDLSELRKPVQVEQVTVSVAPNAKEEELVAVVDSTVKWQEIRNLWREVRDKIEAVITNLPDGRYRRPYNNLARVSYEDVIYKLRTDGWITEAQADAADEMNRRFLQLKPTPKSEITDEDLQNFRNWKTAFDGSSGGS